MKATLNLDIEPVALPVSINVNVPKLKPSSGEKSKRRASLSSSPYRLPIRSLTDEAAAALISDWCARFYEEAGAKPPECAEVVNNFGLATEHINEIVAAALEVPDKDDPPNTPMVVVTVEELRDILEKYEV